MYTESVLNEPNTFDQIKVMCASCLVDISNNKRCRKRDLLSPSVIIVSRRVYHPSVCLTTSLNVEHIFSVWLFFSSAG